MITVQKKIKSYIQYIIVGSLFINLLVSCDKCLFKRTSSGLEYRVVNKGDGTKPVNGQILLIDISYQTKDKKNKKDQKVIFSSEDTGSPMILPYNDTMLYADGGIYEAISMLEKGDSMIFKISAKKLLGDAFSELASKHSLQESTPLYVHMHLKDIQSEEEFKDNLAKQHNAMIEKRKEEAAKQLPKDIEIITKYLTANNIKALSTSSGLRYVIDKPGKGSNAKPGNTVKVNYVGTTLEGKIFDTNIAEVAQKHNIYDSRRPYEPMKFTIGEDSLIPGFEEGVKLLNKHAKARLFIPSVLAYGPYQIGNHITPNSNLIFEIELVDIMTN